MLADAFILADRFGNDILSAFDGCRNIFYISLDEFLCCTLWVMFPLEQEYLGERLQTLFAGYLGPGTALGLVGQIDIFEFGGIPTVVDALLQFECQFVQIGDGLEYRLFTLLDLLKPFILVADSSNLYFIESACAFLALP